MLSRRQFLLSIAPLALAGCTPTEIVRMGQRAAQSGSIEGFITSTAQSHAHSWIANPKQLERDLKRIEKFASEFVAAIESIWGEQARGPSPKVYVKYIDEYQSRTIIDFTEGLVRVESLVASQLKQAIVTTLLSPEDPSKIDLFSAKPVVLGDTPFLYKQVLDQQQKAIRWQWRAEQYANYLLANHKQSQTIKLSNGKTSREHFVEFPLVSNHTGTRQNKYSPLVERYSREYHLEPALVYAIIETESHFNPYAVSWVPAYGLMQIVPKTAGRDAYQLIHRRSGTPSRNYLFDPAKNIHMGCAYLYILRTRYLAKIKHPLSKEYAVIAGYNGGAGNVLRSFSSRNKAAFERINQLSPTEVYQRLRAKMPKESQQYLVKVAKAKQRYT